eukprot:COSAG06_NODE_5218_length_3631_cov_1.108720_2_plen_111_part_00
MQMDIIKAQGVLDRVSHIVTYMISPLVALSFNKSATSPMASNDDDGDRHRLLPACVAAAIRWITSDRKLSVPVGMLCKEMSKRSYYYLLLLPRCAAIVRYLSCPVLSRPV